MRTVRLNQNSKNEELRNRNNELNDAKTLCIAEGKCGTDDNSVVLSSCSHYISNVNTLYIIDTILSIIK